MKAGALRHRLTLQRPNTSGGYDDVATVWAATSVPPKRRGDEELLQGVPIVAVGRTIVTMRYRADVRAEWRVKRRDGRTMQIETYGDPDGYLLELRLVCVELQ